MNNTKQLFTAAWQQFRKNPNSHTEGFLLGVLQCLYAAGTISREVYEANIKIVDEFAPHNNQISD